MSKKMGRPKTDNPINISTTVRLDAKTDEKLKEYCESHKVTKGEAVRKGVILLLATDEKK